MKKTDERYGEAETRQRFDAALRGAFNTPPKQMKDIPRVRPKRKSRKKARAST